MGAWLLKKSPPRCLTWRRRLRLCGGAYEIDLKHVRQGGKRRERTRWRMGRSARNNAAAKKVGGRVARLRKAHSLLGMARPAAAFAVLFGGRADLKAPDGEAREGGGRERGRGAQRGGKEEVAVFTGNARRGFEVKRARQLHELIRSSIWAQPLKAAPGARGGGVI